MNRQVRIFMAGVLVVAPLAATIWVVVWIGGMLGDLGGSLLESTGLLRNYDEPPGWAPLLGVAIMFLVVYFIGLLASIWCFKGLFGMLDRLFSRVPGVKIVYESVRDMLQLFGGEADSMGYVVLYTPEEGKTALLGIVTNENPPGLPNGDNRVIVYLPMGYMIGGPIVYAKRDQIERVDMSVELAMKLAATAFVGGKVMPSMGNTPIPESPSEKS